MNVYCATSICRGTEVDHIFEAESDTRAEEIASENGWQLLVENEVVFVPSGCMERIH